MRSRKGIPDDSDRANGHAHLQWPAPLAAATAVEHDDVVSRFAEDSHQVVACRQRERTGNRLARRHRELVRIHTLPKLNAIDDDAHGFIACLILFAWQKRQ